MSQETLSDFIFSVEHSRLLRQEIRNCINNKMIIDLAEKYGFKINDEDLEESLMKEKVKSWFSKSKISPIKK